MPNKVEQGGMQGNPVMKAELSLQDFHCYRGFTGQNFTVTPCKHLQCSCLGHALTSQKKRLNKYFLLLQKRLQSIFCRIVVFCTPAHKTSCIFATKRGQGQLASIFSFLFFLDLQQKVRSFYKVCLSIDCKESKSLCLLLSGPVLLLSLFFQFQNIHINSVHFKKTVAQSSFFS